MKVKLASVGNPDFGQHPDQPLYGCEADKIVPVKSFKEASELCQQFIEDNDLGAGNWSGGEIFNDKNEVIAHVSYNGRVWEGQRWNPDSKEIKL